MQWLASRYTQRLNYAGDRDGPIFRGRFTSIGIGSDAQLVQTLRCIHLNPVEAGLVAEVAAWPWSSAGSYAGAAAGPDWLVTNRLLDMFGTLDERGAYREFMKAEIDDGTRAFYAGRMTRLAK